MVRSATAKPIRASKVAAICALSIVLALGMAPTAALASTANAAAGNSPADSADSADGNVVLSAGSQEGTRSDGGSDRPDPPIGGGKGGGSDTKTFDCTGLYSGVLSADGAIAASSNDTLTSTTAD